MFFIQERNKMEKEKFIEEIVNRGYEWKEGRHNKEDGILIHKEHEVRHFTDDGIKKLDMTTFKSAVPDLIHMTRIVGYYSRVQNWNPSKLGELKDRQSGADKGGYNVKQGPER